MSRGGVLGGVEVEVVGGRAVGGRQVGEGEVERSEEAKMQSGQEVGGRRSNVYVKRSGRKCDRKHFIPSPTMVGKRSQLGARSDVDRSECWDVDRFRARAKPGVTA